MRRYFKQLGTKFMGLGAAALVRTWMKTLDYRVAHYDPLADLTHPRVLRPHLYVFWHEHILCPLHIGQQSDALVLASKHRDADVLSEVLRHLGLDCMRGSTFGGAAMALRALLSKSREKHLVITPDGPRGPRRVMAQGTVYLATRMGIPIVPIGIGYDRPFRLPTWDEFAIPRPGSRCRVIFGPPVSIPSRLTRKDLDAARLRIEKLLNALTLEAEAWATAGTRKNCETGLHPLRAVKGRFRVDMPEMLPAPHRSPAAKEARLLAAKAERNRAGM